MDDKLSRVLADKELMERIAALVKGEPEDTSPAPPPPAHAADNAVAALSLPTSKELALLDALAPFLKESRRKKLAAARGAISVAGAYKSIKKI